MLDDLLVKPEEKISPLKRWGVVFIVLLVHIFLLFFVLFLSFLTTSPSAKETPLEVVFMSPENEMPPEKYSAGRTGSGGEEKAESTPIAIAAPEKTVNNASPVATSKASEPNPAKEGRIAPAFVLPKQVQQVAAPRTPTVSKRAILPNSANSAVLHTDQQDSYSIPIEEGEEAEEEISIEESKTPDKPINPVLPKKVTPEQLEIPIEKIELPLQSVKAIPDKVSSVSTVVEKKIAAHTEKVEKAQNNPITSKKPLATPSVKEDEQVSSIPIEEGSESNHGGRAQSNSHGQNVGMGSNIGQGSGFGQGKNTQGKGRGFRKGSRYLIGRKIYPDSAKKKNQTGSVRVSVTVSPSGQVEKAALVQSSGVSSLDKAAVETARTQYRYTANSKGGIPEKSTFVFTIEYTLKDGML